MIIFAGGGKYDGDR